MLLSDEAAPWLVAVPVLGVGGGVASAWRGHASDGDSGSGTTGRGGSGTPAVAAQ